MDGGCPDGGGLMRCSVSGYSSVPYFNRRSSPFCPCILLRFYIVICYYLVQIIIYENKYILFAIWNVCSLHKELGVYFCSRFNHSTHVLL
jgi:hypothetical protein